jgi:hypothetical protein
LTDPAVVLASAGASTEKRPRIIPMSGARIDTAIGQRWSKDAMRENSGGKRYPKLHEYLPVQATALGKCNDNCPNSI